MIPPIFRLLPLLLPAVTLLHGGVLVDFGMNGSTPVGHPDQRTTGTSPVWNNLAIGNSAGGALSAGATILIAKEGGLPTLAAAALTDTSGAASGMSISFSSTGTKSAAVGTAGTAGIYSGTRPPLVETLLNAANAWKDSLYINNDTTGTSLTITLTGLDDALSYDLTLFSGRNTTTSNGAIWSLTSGTATTARFQDSTGTFSANTGQYLTSGGTDAGKVIQWLGVRPTNQSIAFRMALGNSLTIDLNALCLTAVPPAVAQEADVYLLGGQSNMQGLGNLAELADAQKTPPADVFYWTGAAFVPLVPGLTVTSSGGNFGPEIAFATEIAKRGRKAYLVKYYNSGKPLDPGWNDQAWLGDPPAPGRVNFHPGVGPSDPNMGTLYQNAMLPRFQAALAAITATGQVPIIRGLVWMQGEQDSKNAVSANRYADNLKRLRNRLAADLGLTTPTDLPVVFGQVLPFEPAEPRFTNRVEIRAEMALADQDSGSPKAIPRCRMVSTDGYPVLPSPDAVHFTTIGQLQLGKAFAEALAGLTAKPIHAGFHHSASGTLAAMAPGTPPLAQGSVVNTATDFWNNLAASAAHTLASTPLRNAADQPAGATLAGSTGYVGTNVNGWASKTKDQVMMDGWFGLVGSESLAVANLPGDLAQHYHVIVYGDSNDSSRTMNYTLGGVTKTIQDNGLFAGSFADGVNRVVFTGLSGSGFVLTGNGDSSRSAVCGISIVPGDPFGVDSFVTSDAYLQPGQSATLSWNVSNADSISISPAIGTVTGTSVVVSPGTTTTYTLTATRGRLSATRSVRVAVGPARPNILLFLVDDMGWQDTAVPFYHDAAGNDVITPLNQRYRTPNMQALAAAGMKFTRAYAHPVCTPTRVSIMTGRNAARHHVTDWTSVTGAETGDNDVAHLRSPTGWLKTGVAAAEITLPKLMADAGCRTIHVGKAHFGSQGAFGQFPQALGFEVNIAGNEIGNPASYYGTANFGTGSNHVAGLEAYHGQNIFLTEAITLEMNKALERAVADGAPFFAYMAQYAVHSPFNEDARFAANYPALSGGERAYATLIEGMDKSLGDIRAKLEALGVAENTLIVFLSDNGGDCPISNSNTNPIISGNAPLRGKKGMRYEGGIRVPMIAAWAKRSAGNVFQSALPIPAGSRQDDLVHVTDLFPTLLGAAGVSFGHPVDGFDLRPYLTAAPGHHRSQSLVTHFPHGHNNDHFSIYHEGDWKLIFNYADESCELYNLATDLGEQTDLSASQPARVMTLARTLARQLNGMGAQFPQNINTASPQPPRTPADATVDTDTDGIPDLTEDPNRNGLIDSGETAPEKGDTDGDGTDDGSEVRLGLDPLDPGKVFRASLETTPFSQFKLTWPSRPGTTFKIRQSSEIGTPVPSWRIFEQGIPADGTAALTSRMVPATGMKGFFAIELE